MVKYRIGDFGKLTEKKNDENDAGLLINEDPLTKKMANTRKTKKKT